jgi:hypothetical protein
MPSGLRMPNCGRAQRVDYNFRNALTSRSLLYPLYISITGADKGGRYNFIIWRKTPKSPVVYTEFILSILKKGRRRAAADLSSTDSRSATASTIDKSVLQKVVQSSPIDGEALRR